MSITDVIHAVQALSRAEKIRLARLLLDELATEKLAATLENVQVFPICTPEYAPNVAAQLARLLEEEETRS
jgi:hypothetical protein